MTHLQLEKFLKDTGLPNRWWIVVDGNLLSEPRPLCGVASLAQADPDATIYIVHDSEAEK